MANYNLTNQTISSSFQQLLQKDVSTGTLYDGTGSVVSDLDITSSYALTASYAENVVDPTWDEIQNKPSGLVSGSEQIDITQTTGNLTSSRIDGIVLSASYAENGGVTSIIAGNNISIDQSTGDVTISSTTTASADWNNLTNKPAGIVSGSEQIDLSLATGVAVSASYALTASFLEGSVESAQYADNTIVYGKNLTGAEILKGTPLYFTGSGTNGNIVGVYPADAGNPARMPAGGVAGQDIAIAGEGRIFLNGFLNGVDTSAFGSGDAIYVGVGGGYTNVKPTGSANLIQALGYVEKSDINGSGVIQGSGRANDVPNISNGYGWFGNSDGVAIPQSTGSFAKTDLSNIFTQNQTITGSLQASQQVAATQLVADEELVSPSIASPTGTLTIFNNTIVSGSVNLSPNNQISATQVVADDSLVAPFIESPTGTVTIGSNTIVSGSIQVQSGNPVVATQFQAEEGVVTPVIESPTGTITLGMNTIVSGSLILEQGNPIEATQLQAVEELVTPAIASPTGTVTIFNNTVVSGSLTLEPNRPLQASQLQADEVVTPGIASTTGTIELNSYIHFQGGMKTNVGNVAFPSADTASVEFDNVTMQVLDLPGSGVTHIETLNVQDGQVINVLVKQNGTSTVTLASNIKQSSGASYQVTQGAGARDILTFATYDYSSTNEVYLINVVNLV